MPRSAELKEKDRLYQARKRAEREADPEAYAAYLAYQRAHKAIHRKKMGQLTMEEYRAKLAEERATRDAARKAAEVVEAADREAARWQREYRRKEKLRLEVERRVTAAAKAGKILDKEAEVQRREILRAKDNARRREQRQTEAAGTWDPSPRILAGQILGSSVNLTEDKEALGWEWYDMLCPRCPEQQKMVTDKQYVWCNECAYELKGMIA